MMQALLFPIYLASGLLQEIHTILYVILHANIGWIFL